MKYVGSIFTKLTTFSLALAAALVVSVQAQPQQGTATVRAIKGSADYTEGGVWQKLTVGKVLKAGAMVKTASDSQVDLYLKDNGPVVRVTADTLLGLDKLMFENTGADTVIETRLDLKNGRILGNVKKTAATSVYEVKIPTGTVGIRGTKYDISTIEKAVYVQTGSLVVHYTDSTTGVTTDYTVNEGQVFVAGRGVLEIAAYNPTYQFPSLPPYDEPTPEVFITGPAIPPVSPTVGEPGPALYY